MANQIPQAETLKQNHPAVLCICVRNISRSTVDRNDACPTSKRQRTIRPSQRSIKKKSMEPTNSAERRGEADTQHPATRPC